MGWFGNNDDPPQPPVVAPGKPDYTLDSVKDLLERIGMARLQVRDPDVKVLLSQIAWNGEDFLTRESPGKEPSGGQIVKLCKQLETVDRVLGEFCKIEQQPIDGSDVQELLAQGRDALMTFASRIVTAAPTVGGSADKTAYAVDTQILSM